MMKPISFEHRVPGILLPFDYRPSPHTVIVGRGKEPKQSMGTKRLRVLAQSFLQKYQDGDKKCKTQIVSDIVCMIHDACKGGKGAFVKHAKNCRWYEQDYSVAREKVGYVFRDLLADEYKSSSKSKVARRRRPTLLQRQESTSSMQSSSSSSTISWATDRQHAIMVVSDDETASTSSSSSFSGVSDFLIQSGALFLDEQFEMSFPERNTTTLPRSSFSFHIDEDADFDYESLLRMPLLTE
jgi:hypothetical protein